LPSPAEVIASFPLLWFDRALTRNLAVSFQRVVEGFALAVAVSFPLGVLMGAFTKVKAAFTPLTVFGAYLPIPTLVPLTLSLFGTGEMQKVMFLALAFSIYLVPLFVAAVDAVDDTYLKTAYTLGASKGETVGRVLLPIAWPEICRRCGSASASAGATSCSQRWSTSAAASEASSSRRSGAGRASTST
jgi:NitT/TauT family transport system permease protein